MNVCLDTGSEADCVSEKLAIKLRSMGCGWGKSGGRIQLANGSEVVRAGELRLLLAANRSLKPADGTQLCRSHYTALLPKAARTRNRVNLPSLPGGRPFIRNCFKGVQKYKR